MKIKDMNLQMLKAMQFAKFSKFGISDEILEELFKKASENTNSEDEIKNNFAKKVDEYLLNELKKGNIDIEIKVIDNCKSIKTITAQKYQNLNSKEINTIYEQAIDYLKYRYNENNSIGLNIVDNIKYIIANNMVGKEMDNKEVKLYDLSFMNEYIRLNKEKIDELSKELNCDRNTFIEYIKGTKKVTKDQLDTLCIIFDANSYDELKLIMIETVNRQKVSLLIQKAKQNEAKYDIRFMKEYLQKKNISKEKFAELLGVNVSSIDKILDGAYTISENKISILYKMFNVNNYNELKNKVNNIVAYIKKKEEVEMKKLHEIHKQNLKDFKEYHKQKEEVEMKKLHEIHKQNLKDFKEYHKQKEEQTKPEEVKRDLSFFKEYIKEYNYSKNKLANLLNCGSAALEKVLDGTIKVKDSLLWELYTEFHVKDYDELKLKINERINDKEKNPKQVITIKEEKKVDDLDIIKSLDRDLILKLLNINTDNMKDYTISIFLFGGINNKYYSFDEIASFMKVDKNYIEELYKKDLEIIKNSLKELNDEKVKSFIK